MLYKQILDCIIKHQLSLPAIFLCISLGYRQHSESDPLMVFNSYFSVYFCRIQTTLSVRSSRWYTISIIWVRLREGPVLWRTLSVSVSSCLWARKSLEKYQKERYVYRLIVQEIRFHLGYPYCVGPCEH